MALSQPRLEFHRAGIKQLDELLSTYPSLKLTNADKDAIKTAIAAAIQAIQTANAAETDPAVWIADLETLKSDASTEVEDGISSLEQIKAAIIATYTDPQECAQCQGLGKIVSTVDVELIGQTDWVDGSTYVVCPLCAGDGKTEGAYEAVYPDDVIPTYEPV